MAIEKATSSFYFRVRFPASEITSALRVTRLRTGIIPRGGTVPRKLDVSQECPRRLFFRDEGEGSTMPGKRRSGASNSRATGAEGDEKFYERARRHRRHWFELHQLKKAVPQKFHNAASRRVVSRRVGVSGGGEGRPSRQMSELSPFFRASAPR